jgi:hypothetical protein
MTCWGNTVPRSHSRDRERAADHPRLIPVTLLVLLTGITVAASLSWASREANAPGTRTLIAELFEANSERINAVFDHTLGLIEDAFEARDAAVTKFRYLRFTSPTSGSTRND